MYSPKWSPTLRQGDVIGPLPTPMVGNEQKVVMATADPLKPPDTPANQWIFSAPMKHVVVASHDCEFNEDKRDRLIVARLSSTDPRWSEEKLDELRLSNDIEGRHQADEKVDYVDTFLMEPVPGEFEACHFAHFSTLTPISMSYVTSLHLAKKAEMEHDQRLLFRRKLAWYFLRNPADVDEDLKRDPSEVRWDLGSSDDD